MKSLFTQPFQQLFNPRCYTRPMSWRGSPRPDEVLE